MLHVLRRVGKTVGFDDPGRDPICPAPQTQPLADRLAADGAAVRLVWQEGGHEVARQEPDAVAALLQGQGKES